jgi:hypothetical protein
MTDEMDGKARKMSVTSSDGRNSICMAAVDKSVYHKGGYDPSRGQFVLQRFVRVSSGSDEFRTRRCGRSIRASRQGNQFKRSPALGLITKTTC